LQDLEEPRGEDSRYVRRKSMGGGEDFGMIRALTVTLLRAQGPDVGGLRSGCVLSSTRRSLVEWGLVSLLSEHLQSKAKSIGK
jgi:hypothetical protein